MFKHEGIKYSPIHENWNTDIAVLTVSQSLEVQFILDTQLSMQLKVIEKAHFLSI